MNDETALVKALRDLGFSNVEAHGKPQQLQSLRGNREKADVVIKRGFGIARNDLGFRRGPNGCFQLLCPAREKVDWLDNLVQRYVYHVTRAKLEEQGFSLVTDEVKDGERLHLVLRRMV